MNTIEYNLIDVYPEDNPLGNCYVASIVHNGIQYPSVEHAYQLLKFYNNQNGFSIEGDVYNKIFNEPIASNAKQTAKLHTDKIVLTEIDERVKLITELMRAKFDQHPELKQFLIETHPAHLYEDCPVYDPKAKDFWAVQGEYGGDNTTGNILMMLRDEYLDVKR